MTLRAPQHPVDEKSVGVGFYLRSDPGHQPHQGRRQRLPEPEHPLEARKSDLYALPPTVLVGPLGYQRDPAFGQGMRQRFTSVGEVPKEAPREILARSSGRFASASNSSVRRTSATLAGVSS